MKADSRKTLCGQSIVCAGFWKIWLVLNIHRCSSEKAKAAALSFMPILSWLPSYPVKKYLFSDVVSGLSTGVVQLPQGQWAVQQHCVKHWGCEQGRLRLRATVFCFMLTLFWHRWHFDTVMESLNLQDCLFGNVLSSLLHRTSLRYAGCGASCLWSVLLLLPGPAVHLLWHVQTHISRWEIRLCSDLMALCDLLCLRTRKDLQYAFFYTLWWCFLIHINGVLQATSHFSHSCVCSVSDYEVHLVTQWFRLRDERCGANVCICANCVLSFHGRIVTFQRPHPVTASFPWNGSKSQMPAVTYESLWQLDPMKHLTNRKCSCKTVTWWGNNTSHYCRIRDRWACHPKAHTRWTAPNGKEV